jgi:transcriptional regulator with XRE-family HTH domain
MPTNANLGAAIRRLRHERGLTIESLAFASDIHPTYLSEIERGNRNPTWQIVCRLARALDTPVATVAHDAEAEERLAQRMAEVRGELGLS